MTIVTWEERISRRPAGGVRKGTLKRLAWFALTAAVWVSCALIGALFLQALEAAASR